MNELGNKLLKVVETATRVMAEPIVVNNCKRLGIDPDNITREDLPKLIPKIEEGVRFFVSDPSKAKKVIDELEKILV